MYKATLFSLIFLLSFSQSVKCNQLDTEISNAIRFFSNELDSCAEYFKYVRIYDFIHGNLTLPNMQIGDKVQIFFASEQIFGCKKDFLGFLLPDGSSEEIINRVRSGQTISYRVDFPLLEYVPTIIKIVINENSLCSTKYDDYQSPADFILRHTLEVNSDCITDLTHNPYIPNYKEVRSCGLVDTKVTINGVSPLTYGLTEMSSGRHSWPSAFYERQASLMIQNMKSAHSDVLMLNQNGLWMPENLIAAGFIFQPCNSKHLQQNAKYCDIASHISKLESYVEQQEKPVIGSLNEICGKPGAQSRTEHPWLVAVYVKYKTGLNYFRSGILLSSRSVLVSAGSFERLNPNYSYQYRVHVGSYNLCTVKENEVVGREIATFTSHPTSGLTILQIKAPVVFSQYIKPICLPTEPTDSQVEIVGQNATVIGWNYSKLCEKPTPQSEDVSIVAAAQCKKGSTDVLHKLCIHHFANMKIDFLILKRNGSWLLQGVHAARVYTNFTLYDDVAENLSWIQNNTLV